MSGKPRTWWINRPYISVQKKEFDPPQIYVHEVPGFTEVIEKSVYDELKKEVEALYNQLMVYEHAPHEYGGRFPNPKIEQLQAKVDKLVEALKEISDIGGPGDLPQYYAKQALAEYRGEK